jgi:Fur family zinc uptake transcriptional regulator
LHAAAFLICDCCGATREIASAANPIEALGEAAGYALTGVTIEAHGLCADCKA